MQVPSGNAPSIANFNTYQPAGFYSAQPTTVGKPDPEGWGSYVASLGSSAADRAAYLIMRSGSVAIKAWLAKREGGTLTTTELYHLKNIVGTVSHLDGIPTGAGFERGDGVVGHYTKMADGTLMCWLTLTIPAHGLNQDASAQSTWPAQFIGGLRVFWSISRQVGGGSAAMIGLIQNNGIYNGSDLSTARLNTYSYRNAITEPVEIFVCGLGRWI